MLRMEISATSRFNPLKLIRVLFCVAAICAIAIVLLKLSWAVNRARLTIQDTMAYARAFKIANAMRRYELKNHVFPPRFMKSDATGALSLWGGGGARGGGGGGGGG